MEISVSIVFIDIHAFDGTPPPFIIIISYHLAFGHSRLTQVALFFLLIGSSFVAFGYNSTMYKG